MQDRFYRAFARCSDNFSADILLRKFEQTGDDVYDDAFTLTQSGTDQWLKGTIQSLNTTQGSTDSNLLEQGKLITQDTKIFFNGSIILTGSYDQFKLQIGSPTGDWYSMVPIGNVNRQVAGSAIFETAYVRRLTNGSLVGE